VIVPSIEADEDFVRFIQDLAGSDEETAAHRSESPRPDECARLLQDARTEIQLVPEVDQRRTRNIGPTRVLPRNIEARLAMAFAHGGEIVRGQNKEDAGRYPSFRR